MMRGVIVFILRAIASLLGISALGTHWIADRLRVAAPQTQPPSQPQSDPEIQAQPLEEWPQDIGQSAEEWFAMLRDNPRQTEEERPPAEKAQDGDAPTDHPIPNAAPTRVAPSAPRFSLLPIKPPQRGVIEYVGVSTPETRAAAQPIESMPRIVAVKEAAIKEEAVREGAAIHESRDEHAPSRLSPTERPVPPIEKHAPSSTGEYPTPPTGEGPAPSASEPPVSPTEERMPSPTERLAPPVEKYAPAPASEWTPMEERAPSPTEQPAPPVEKYAASPASERTPAQEHAPYATNALPLLQRSAPIQRSEALAAALQGHGHDQSYGQREDLARQDAPNQGHADSQRAAEYDTRATIQAQPPAQEASFLWPLPDRQAPAAPSHTSGERFKSPWASLLDEYEPPHQPLPSEDEAREHRQTLDQEQRGQSWNGLLF